MLIYSKTKKEFSEDVKYNRIGDKILELYKLKMHRRTSESEIRAWNNSMQYMNNVLSISGIPDNTGVAIEYKIPQSSKRIDIILTGKDSKKNDTAIIVELKQWSKIKRTVKDGIVQTYIGSGEREIEHPSYQAWSYAALLQDFNETIRKENIQLRPCAYLHNCESNDEINHSFYNEYTSKAPSFLKFDSEKLSSFIKSFIKYGDMDEIMYRIDNGKISPSKNLADKLVSLLRGNQEFIMIDDQKIVYETVLDLTNKATEETKHVLIVEGGPGTGKSVIAINLLVELTKRKKLTQYVTKNAAPRIVYEHKLTGTFTKSHISNLFKSSGVFTSCEENAFQVLLVDEAHRLNKKSGFYQNQGENQIKEIIQASNLSIFFIDEKQKVTLKDIGDKEEIISWAKKLKVNFQEMKLNSQFRCNGSDSFLDWIDDALQINEIPNLNYDTFDYDFQVLDNPNELRDLIFRKNSLNNKARLVAGYCWDWVTKKNSTFDQYDISIDKYKFAMKWNLSNDGNLWILKPESVNEIGCIHTCQGLELDYIGVIIGPDIVYRDGELTTLPEKRAKTDQSLKGYKSLLKINPTLAYERADKIIKNTYRTLMTRGQKGCYIYCTDSETNEYFRKLLRAVKFTPPTENEIATENKIKTNQQEKYLGLSLSILDHKDVKPFINSVPIYNLQMIANPLSEITDIEEFDWVSLPTYIRCTPDLFLVQMIGESMNRRIPSGTWCLFKRNSIDSYNEKIVLVYHPEIYDEDLECCFTIKHFFNKKILLDNGKREYQKIILKPDTSAFGYKDIEINGDETKELKIIGEFMASF